MLLQAKDSFITFPVISSNIATLGHNDSTQTLRVHFKSGLVYNYANVNHAQFRSLLDAESVGKAFNASIKSKPSQHPFTKG